MVITLPFWKNLCPCDHGFSAGRIHARKIIADFVCVFFPGKAILMGTFMLWGENIYNFNCPCWRFVFEDGLEGWIRVGLLIEIRHMFISIRVRAMDLPSSTLEGQKLLRRMVDNIPTVT